MIINIEELECQKEGKLNLEFNELIHTLDKQSPVIGDFEIISKGLVIEIKGKVHACVTLECDRCLKEFLHHVDLDIDEKFVKGKIIDDNVKELELKGENFVEELGDAQEIDLTDLIYQNIILSLPTKKLCNENCEGSEELKKYTIEKPSDPRMQVFKDLENKFK
ncbi:MAG: YceD family protein [Candidatus Gastranaerophilaceae bacterium]